MSDPDEKRTKEETARMAREIMRRMTLEPPEPHDEMKVKKKRKRAKKKSRRK